ncbi:EF hand, partial [Opisthorchis viverrini]
MAAKLTDKEIADIFKVIDKDGNGKITKRELSKFFKNNKAEYSSKQIKTYIKSIDKDG